MRRIELEKNCLDIEYQKNLQFLNSVLIIGGGSIIAYLASLILDLNKWKQYSAILFLILVSALTVYNKTNKNLKSVSQKIRNLSSSDNITYINK